ncbi:hypothetical protein EDC32_102416 [Laceyella sacchari]|uniref:hypothetical protein n=1 Tax=Laceyella sacchari TaxID=37482 RepID=UPI00104331FD|nr:hypothetical protein [Laceyella sacchari]TCW39170.1 hypothetical protein EDC32_102416 [Laceyella sacchari]
MYSSKKLKQMEKQIIIKAFEENKEEVDQILKKILSYPFPEGVQSIYFSGETFEFGLGFDARPADESLRPHPLHGEEDFGAAGFDFEKYVEELIPDKQERQVFLWEHLDDFLVAAEDLCAKWLSERFKELGGESFPIPCFIGFEGADDVYHLQAGKYV